MKRKFAAAAIIAGLVVATASAAEPEAQVGWGLEFGGALASAQPTMRLGLVSGDVAFQRTYRANASDAPPTEQTTESGGAGSWVPWVVGGVVAIVAIGANVAKDHDPTIGPCVACDDDPNAINIPPRPEADTGCVGDECAFCQNGSVASTCDDLVARPMRGESEIDVERLRWLDAGTGHMGDLFAR
jgi:hypothetical protein